MYSECVCILSFPADKAHAAYCHLWPVWLYHIFPCFLIKSTIFIELKICVLMLSRTSV